MEWWYTQPRPKPCLFQQFRGTLNHGKFNLQIGDTSISRSDKERKLGITVDNSLKWSAQVEATLNKCNSLLYLLGCIKIYLELYYCKLFFNAYILSHLDYCSTFWGNSSTIDTDRVVKFYKRAARVILDKDIDTPKNELFKQLGWMRSDERVNFCKAVMMFKALHNLAPTYTSSKFTYTNIIHQVNLSGVEFLV